MNTLTVNFPVPPAAVMPEPLQTIVFWVTVIGALVVLSYSLLMAKKHGSAVPVLMVVAAGAAIPLEAIVTFLGHVIHPPEEAMILMEAVDRTIPWHMLFIYVIGFGVMYLVLFSKSQSGPIPTSFVWKTWGVGVVFYILMEIYPVQAGLWVYYDDQPLWLWKGMAPLTWSFLNSTCELMGATLILLIVSKLKGWKQILLIPLAPIGSLMGHMGAGWPMYSVMNSSASTDFLILQASGVATIACAFAIVWIAATILGQPRPE